MKIDMFANRALLTQVSEQAKVLSQARVASLRTAINEEETRVASELKSFEAEYVAIAESLGIEGWAELAGVEAIPADDGAFFVREKGAHWAVPLVATTKWKEMPCGWRLTPRQNGVTIYSPHFLVASTTPKCDKEAVRAGIALLLVDGGPMDNTHRPSRLGRQLLSSYRNIGSGVPTSFWPLIEEINRMRNNWDRGRVWLEVR
ncbi:MAG TPA: hypothetical protein VJG48_01865 [Candidatus Paceibacterota bacterium]